MGLFLYLSEGDTQGTHQPLAFFSGSLSVDPPEFLSSCLCDVEPQSCPNRQKIWHLAEIPSCPRLWTVNNETRTNLFIYLQIKVVSKVFIYLYVPDQGNCMKRGMDGYYKVFLQSIVSFRNVFHILNFSYLQNDSTPTFENVQVTPPCVSSLVRTQTRV